MTKIKYYLLFAAAITYLISFYSCLNSISGEGETTFATRNIEKFTEIELNLDADVYITDSLEQSCMISAQENLMPVIETRLKGQKLIISSEKNIQNNKPIIIYLSANRLSAIELNGSGKITGNNSIKSDNLLLHVSGSGEMNLQVITNHLKADLSGSGTLTLHGSANDCKMEISGSGVIDAFNLNTGDCDVRISGSGKIFVMPAGELNADISGSGSVRYKGTPAKINSAVSGSGNIEKSE